MVLGETWGAIRASVFMPRTKLRIVHSFKHDKQTAKEKTSSMFRLRSFHEIGVKVHDITFLRRRDTPLLNTQYLPTANAFRLVYDFGLFSSHSLLSLAFSLILSLFSWLWRSIILLLKRAVSRDFFCSWESSSYSSKMARSAFVNTSDLWSSMWLLGTIVSII